MLQLTPSQWGMPFWKMLHAISFGCSTPEVPDSVVQMMDNIGGILPCTYCRASYPTFYNKSLEFRGKSSLKELPGHMLPRFMYDLHNMVNYKLDWQYFGLHQAPKIAKALGISQKTIESVLLKHNPTTHPLKPDDPPPFYAGKHPTWECVQQRNSVFTLKVTAADVMAVLFMVALAYPCILEDKDWETPKHDEDKNTPAQRRQMFVKFITSLPGVLRASKCGDEKLASIIENVWRFCTQSGGKMRGADPVVTAIMAELSESMQKPCDLQAVCVFQMVWVIRAIYKDGVCSATPELAREDQQAHHTQFRAAQYAARSLR